MERSEYRSLAISVVALLIFFALTLQAVLAKSPTADEGMHLLRSQVLRQTDELELQGQHAPLSHWLIGTFLFSEPTMPPVSDLPSWPRLSPEDLVQEFLWLGQVYVGRLLFLGRLPIVFAGLLLGALVSRWSKLLVGNSGQIIALTLYAFAPNLLASASLATTDLVATAAYFGAVFGVWYYWRRPSLARWLLAGLTLGLAISSKLSGLLVLPVTLVLCYGESWRGSWWRPGLRWLTWFPLAGLVLWAAYGFEIDQIAGMPIPLPAPTFLSNFVQVQEHIERGHYAFLLGQRSNEGWWGYFGLAYLLKTPTVTLALLVIAVIYVTGQRLWRRTMILWLPVGALFIAASASRLNIGYRHILPVTPFIWLFIAMTGPMWRRQRVSQWLLAALLTFYALGTFRQMPHFLAYFNEIVGGSTQGYRFLGDSNIDWGQDLGQLAEYAQDVEAGGLYISYFGPSDPAYYGLDAPPLFDEAGTPTGFAPANPAPGRYAISVNHLQGATPEEPDLFDWFRDREPLDHLGYSILIYEVQNQKQGAWIAHCLDPVPLLDESTAELYVDRSDARHVYFDCGQSWVLPGGDQSGWYIVPIDHNSEMLNSALAENLALEFLNQAGGYKIYHWSGSSADVERIGGLADRYTLSGGAPVTLPVSVDGLAQLVGGFVNGSVWASIWRTDGPSEAPVSVLMHLYPEQPASDAPSPLVGDGLGFVAAHWQPGDLIIQYHGFGPAEGDFLETGLYDFMTGERFPLLLDDEQETAVRIYP
jgi:4-amino-4-deoxy-L-arabinose transferase-like glycosyltransferase